MTNSQFLPLQAVLVDFPQKRKNVKKYSLYAC
jgi:hypothetical protein